jgi:dTDP-4-amino-4,6-dideoxygalactose transaminase
MNPYDTVRNFESVIAEYAGSQYAVAVDTCTDALFLCCKYLNVQEVTIPCHTYVSVPCAIIHAGGKVKFSKETWQGIYSLKPYPIIDAACRLYRNMYHQDTFWCISFQYRKHIPIGRGGMILTNSKGAYEWFKLARFSGRHEVPLIEDTPAMIGWHCYMEPERAAKGLTFMLNIQDKYPDLCFTYPDLSTFNLYEKKV